MKKEAMIILSLGLILFCGCIGSPDKADIGSGVVLNESTTSSLTSSSTTAPETTTTSTVPQTTSSSTTSSTTSTTSSTTLPEFYDAGTEKINGVSLKANLIGVLGEIRGEENCDGKPCGGGTVTLVPVKFFSGRYNESAKLAVVGVQLSNFGKEDVLFNGSFSIELSDGSICDRTYSLETQSKHEYDLIGFYLRYNNTFTVPAKGTWVNKLVFKVPRKSDPNYLIYQSDNGKKYKYDLKKT
jgi:hypothetical protein